MMAPGELFLLTTWSQSYCSQIEALMEKPLIAAGDEVQ